MTTRSCLLCVAFVVSLAGHGQLSAGLRIGLTSDRSYRTLVFPLEANLMTAISEDGRWWMGAEGGWYLRRKEEATTTYGPNSLAWGVANAVVTTKSGTDRGDLGGFFQFRVRPSEGPKWKIRSLYVRFGPMRSWTIRKYDSTSVSTITGVTTRTSGVERRATWFARHVVGYEWNARKGVWCIEALGELGVHPILQGYGVRLGHAWRSRAPNR